MENMRFRRLLLTAAISCATLLSAGAQAEDLRIVYKVSGLKQVAAPSASNPDAPEPDTPKPGSFTSHTFTTCGASAASGPTLAACQSSYAGASWAQDLDSFSVLHEGKPGQGIQVWTVPETGLYRIEAAGASIPEYRSTEYGRGAILSGDFSLQAGQQLAILVGQNYNYHFGAGGTFVVDFGSSSPLIVAGGGGGAPGTTLATPCSTSDASFTTTGNPGCGANRTNGGTDGQGATSKVGRAGAGFLTNSVQTDHNNRKSHIYGFMPTLNGQKIHLSGAYGGGGTYQNTNSSRGIASGGGGGYSGGGVGSYGGGGGGSFNAGTNPQNIGYNAMGNQGHVTITRI